MSKNTIAKTTQNNLVQIILRINGAKNYLSQSVQDHSVSPALYIHIKTAKLNVNTNEQSKEM